MIPELAIACLACARIGAVHSVVFGGFSSEALKNRITDCDGKMLITANAGVRGGKSVPLKQNADVAMEGTNIEYCMVVKHTEDECEMQSGRDYFWHEEKTWRTFEINDTYKSKHCEFIERATWAAKKRLLNYSKCLF